MTSRRLAMLALFCPGGILTQEASAWYSPQLGRWLTRDPIRYEGGTRYLYEYAGGGPPVKVDPFGTVSFDDTDCGKSPPTSDTSGCGVHAGVVLWGLDAECVCKCAGDSPWDNQVRGCLDSAQRAGVDPEEAHERCYAIADKEHGFWAGLGARLDIGLSPSCDCGVCGDFAAWNDETKSCEPIVGFP